MRLKALEAYTRDVGRGVARIDYDSMDSLTASTGDVIEIRGKRRTVAKCLPLYPSDEGKGIIRVDGPIRNNAGIAMGDEVNIVKTVYVPAIKITIKPLSGIPSLDERYIADALDNVPVIKNDNIMVPYFGGRLNFQVIEHEPADSPVTITTKTEISIQNTTDYSSTLELTTREKEILNKVFTKSVATAVDSKILTLYVLDFNVDSSEFESLSKKFR